MYLHEVQSMRNGSRRHHIEWLAPNAYSISWEIDKNAMGARLRFPMRRRSVTDRKGAERFASKWGLVVPAGKLRKAPTSDGAQ